MLFSSVALAQSTVGNPTWPPSNTKGDAGKILDQVYGSHETACTRDLDADTGEHNRLGPFTANRLYEIYCHNGSGVGVACECLMGTSSVNVSTALVYGMVLFAGEKVVARFKPGYLYLSCEPYANNQLVDVCPMGY